MKKNSIEIAYEDIKEEFSDEIKNLEYNVRSGNSAYKEKDISEFNYYFNITEFQKEKYLITLGVYLERFHSYVPIHTLPSIIEKEYGNIEFEKRAGFTIFNIPN